MQRLKLIRHGVVFSGGARYEEYLIRKLSEELTADNTEKKYEVKVFNRLYKGIANFKLFLDGWANSNAEVNVVTARIALPSLLRNAFTRNKTVVILHNHDEKDEKSWFLHLYFKALFFYVRSFGNRVCIVTVSPYFQEYFQKIFPLVNVYLIPNFFDTKKYLIYRSERKPENILLGQYSSKNGPEIFELAKKLTALGYKCFFCTLNPSEVKSHPDYEIISVGFDEYLHKMATSYCSIAFTGINEGWGRMAHESILVGTPVIGFDKGGLGNLLKESNSYIVNTVNEAVNLIKNKKVDDRTPPDFIARYDVSQASNYLQPLISFILN